jgi:hypothetical protein
MAFIYKRGKVYYVGYRITVLDENENKIRKQVSAPISPDKQAADEFAAKKTLSEYADKKKLDISFVRNIWLNSDTKTCFKRLLRL